MINMTRGEAFEIGITLDVDPVLLEALSICFAQNGRTVCTREIGEVLEYEGQYSAACRLAGEETARFDAFGPAYAQAEATLKDGEKLHSNVEEINVVDILQKGLRIWGSQ